MIKIRKKKVIEPRSPSQLEAFKAYRVHSIRDGYRQCDVGDIVLRFPNSNGGAGTCVLNCTRQEMFYRKDGLHGNDYNHAFHCVRAYDIEQIIFHEDHQDMPHVGGQGETSD